MTDEQVKNFRNVLCLSIGPYALIMPREEIAKWRDKLQRDVGAFDKKIQEENKVFDMRGKHFSNNTSSFSSSIP